MNLTRKVKKTVKNKDDFICFPYTDSSGNVLNADDILFISSKKKGKQLVEMWESEIKEVQGTNVYEKGFKRCFDKPGTFPIVLVDENEETLDQKISKKTGEYLQMHAGSAKNVSVVLGGAPDCCKSTYMVTLSDTSNQNAIARGKQDFSLMNDEAKGSPCEQEYKTYLENFKKKILPERTRYAGKLNSFHYYVKNGMEDANLILFDASGEECMRAGWDSQILHAKYFLYMIAADDLLACEKTGVSQYEQVLKEVICKKNIKSEDKDFEILLVITKCDLLNRNNPYLKRAFENSVSVKEERLEQITHKEGFDGQAFQEKSDAVEKYLADTCPKFLNNLKSLVSEGNLSFSIMATIGEE